MHTPHFSDILLIIKAVDNRAGAEEKYCFEEGMGADVKEGQLGLVKPNSYYYKA